MPQLLQSDAPCGRIFQPIKQPEPFLFGEKRLPEENDGIDRAVYEQQEKQPPQGSVAQ